MISKLWCYFIISITLISIPAYPILPQLDSSTLVTANLFFRHGARTPLVDPHPRAQIQKVKWSDGPGILTKVGKEKMFDLGKALKVYFQEFLFPLHSYDEIKLSTTGVQRTEQSAIALVAGLFGPVEQEKWKDGVTIPPIVFNVDETIDKSTIINSPNACPLFKVEQKVTIEKARVADRGFEDVYRFLTPYAGVQVNGMFDIFPLWDNLECMHHNKLELPNWTSYVYPSRMSQVMAKVLRSMIVGSDTMIRLAAGPYIQEVQDQFRMAAAGVPSVKKLIIHGGHDFSMTANLGALGIFEKIVNPGDALLLELHYVKKYGYFVQAVYFDAGGSNITVLKIKNCGQLCPLDKFMELTKNSIPRNWNSECIAYRPRL